MNKLHLVCNAHLPHGVALGNKITDMGRMELQNPEIEKWVQQAARWAESVVLKQNKEK